MRSMTLYAACFVFGLGSLASQVNAQEICRTAGFWGTHAGEEKPGSTNIAEEVISAWLSTKNSIDQTNTENCEYNAMDGTVSCDFEPPGQAGSPKACRDAKKSDVTLFNMFPEGTEGIEICGKTISVEQHGSQIPPVVEAICVAPNGDSRLQLGRQLTAAALNCIMSGGGENCENTSIGTDFEACNATCADPLQEDQVNTCIEKIDCFNNGGLWNEDDPQAMYCQMDVVESCHAQPLIGTVVNDSEDPEEPPAPM